MRRIVTWLHDWSLRSLGILLVAIGVGVLLVVPGRGERAVGLAAVAAGLCALVLELYDPETRKPFWIPVFVLGTLGWAGVSIGLSLADEAGDLPGAVPAVLVPLGCLYAFTLTQRVKHVDNATLWWTWTVLGWITAPTVVAYAVAAVLFGPDAVMRAVF